MIINFDSSTPLILRSPFCIFIFLMLNTKIVHKPVERSFKKEKSSRQQRQLSSLPGRSETFFFFLTSETAPRPRCIKSTFEIVNTSRVFCFLDESSDQRPLETEPMRWKCRLTLGILGRL